VNNCHESVVVWEGEWGSCTGGTVPKGARKSEKGNFKKGELAFKQEKNGKGFRKKTVEGK